MIVLDTDHISVLTDRNHRQFDTLTHRMLAVDEESFTSTIVTAEEVMRGWLAYIHRQKALPRHVVAYARLSRFLEFFAQWNRLPFDEEAAQEFQRFRKHVYELVQWISRLHRSRWPTEPPC